VEPLSAPVGCGCLITTIGALTTGALSGRDVATVVIEGPLEGRVDPSGKLTCVAGVHCPQERTRLVFQ